MRLDRSFLFTVIIKVFGNISIQNHDSSIHKKSNCGKTLNSMYSMYGESINAPSPVRAKFRCRVGVGQ